MIERTFVLDTLSNQIAYNLNNNNGLLIKEDLRLLKVFVKNQTTLDLIDTTLDSITGTLLTEDAISNVDQLLHRLG